MVVIVTTVASAALFVVGCMIVHVINDGINAKEKLDLIEHQLARLDETLGRAKETGAFSYDYVTYLEERRAKFLEDKKALEEFTLIVLMKGGTMRVP